MALPAKCGPLVVRAACLLALAALISIPSLAQQQSESATVQKGASLASTNTAPMPPFSSHELDALAKSLAAQIHARKIKAVVVVGATGEKSQISELGVSVLEGLTASLSRRANGFSVTDSASVREFLHQSRVSEDMLYSDILAEWIARRLKADGYLTLRISVPSSDATTVTASLSYQYKKKDFVELPPLTAKLTLTDVQAQAANQIRHAFSMPKGPLVPADVTVVPDLPAASIPSCLSCLNPPYTADARNKHIQGIVLLEAVVTPQGIADDVFVASAVNNGLAGQSVNSLLEWKFKPAIGTRGDPVPARIPIEILFQLY
jgi:hypothetical protein